VASVAVHDFREHEMTKRFWAGVVVFGTLSAVGSLQAHHSLAGVYDLKKIERATGVVQKFAFTNPHGALHIAFKNAQGEVKVWQLHTGSANVLTNAGVSATGPDRVKAGDEITVTYNPALNGATIGFLRSIVLPGKKEIGFAPD
jgi:hypothetical protein